MGLINTNLCHRANHHLKHLTNVVGWALVLRGRKWDSFWFSGHRSAAATPPNCACFDGRWWKHRWMWRKLSSVGSCRLFFCGFLLAQEWRFAVWPLGAVGQGSQSSVCSLACRALRVSLAPEGRQTKRHHCLSHWSCSPIHPSFLLEGGTFLFRGGGWQKETTFLETEPQDNKTTVDLSYVMFFFSLNSFFSCCL